MNDWGCPHCDEVIPGLTCTGVSIAMHLQEKHPELTEEARRRSYSRLPGSDLRVVTIQYRPLPEEERRGKCADGEHEVDAAFQLIPQSMQNGQICWQAICRNCRCVFVPR